jgi:hypothetical protein
MQFYDLTFINCCSIAVGTKASSESSQMIRKKRSPHGEMISFKIRDVGRMPRVAKNFDRIDRDKNGYVTVDDLMLRWKSRAKAGCGDLFPFNSIWQPGCTESRRT